ncbi:MAG: signal peptide peptidase SppA [Alphaproteobacteria bacterium]|nr:MAG: signal peptide peptidase SppA [Alphaproteobacteria bacterium]
MKRFFINLLAGLASLTLFFFFIGPLLIALFVGMLASSVDKPVAEPTQIVLRVDLRQPMTDQPTQSPFDFSGETNPSLIGLLNALDRAEGDSRVKGLFIDVGGMSGIGLSQAEEIRDALQSFKAEDKFVIAHAQNMFGAGVGSYAAIADADEIWMQETGVFGATGVGIGSIFLHELMEKIGANPQFVQYKEYKSLPEMFTHDDFSDPHRESYKAVVDSMYDNAMGEISESKSLSPEDIEAALSKSPYLATEALTAGLIDRLGYSYDAQSAALERAGEEAEFVSIGDYSKFKRSPGQTDGTIAVVMAEGNIHEGQSSKSGTPSIGGQTYADFIRAAADDEEVSAILLRVSSGGGSADASDEIWDAVNYAKAKGKPVVASMGAMAASGGYYISMNADRIVALPNTITGSIGVVMGKMDLSGTYAKLGAKVSMVEKGGPNLSLFSGQQPFTEEQWATINRLAEHTYVDFVSKAAAGRGKSFDELEAVAKGRIWTGSQAYDRGLVDDLGGYRAALEDAKILAGFAPDAKVTIKSYPGRKEPVELFMEAFNVSARAAHVMLRFADEEKVGELLRVWETTRTEPGLRLEADALQIN